MNIDLREHIPSYKSKLAIVLYENVNWQTNANGIAVVYDIDEEGEMRNGRPIDEIEFARKFKSAERPARYLDSQIIGIGDDTIIWFEPAHIAPMKLNINEQLKRFSGKSVPFPSLVFKIQGNRCQCRAYKGTARPQEDTGLFAAPLYNTNTTDGWVCLPQQIGMEMSRTNDIFQKMNIVRENIHDGTFTHPSGNDNITRHPKGINGLWLNILKRRQPGKFPERFLTPIQMTLKEFIEK